MKAIPPIVLFWQFNVYHISLFISITYIFSQFPRWKVSLMKGFPLMKMKEESGKVGLKLIIQKTKIMASSPITSWQINGETMKQWETLFWGGSKITANGDCSHEIKRRLLLGRKAMTNLDSILKSSDITLVTKVHLVKAMVFPIVMYGCESWTIKKAECQRVDGFWTVVLEKTLESPLDCKETKPVNP